MKNLVIAVLYLGFAAMGLSAQSFHVAVFNDLSTEEIGMIGVNQFAPGAIQIYEGKDEGYWFLGGMAMMVAGTIIQRQNYIPNPQSPIEAPIGLLLNSIGGSVWSYSNYAYLVDKQAIWPGIHRKTYIELAGAPWDYKTLFTPEVLPILGFALINAATTLLNPEANKRLADWYGKSTISMWGYEMSPVAASFLDFGWSLVTMTGVAIGEEALSRGLVTGSLGTEISAPAFGVFHLQNILLQKPTARNIIHTLLQAVFATGFGFYADKMVKDSNGDLSKSVAFHYWWNVTMKSLDFLSSVIYPEDLAPASEKPAANGDPASGTGVTPGAEAPAGGEADGANTSQGNFGIADFALYPDSRLHPTLMLTFHF